MPLSSEVLAPKPGKKEDVRPQLDVLEFDFFLLFRLLFKLEMFSGAELRSLARMSVHTKVI